MNHFCASCEHPGRDHVNGGRCHGTSIDPDYGRYMCVCPKFERDSE